MASDKVHGITIEIDANTSGVTESFKDINKQLNSTQKELNTVDKMLKQNGDDTRLLAQKQQLLTDAIDETQDKLVRLARAKAEADNSEDVDKNSKAYRELERDIISAQSSLDKLYQQQDEVNDKMSEFAEKTDDVSDSLEDAQKQGLSFGDIIKANVISDAIVSGIKALAKAFVELGKSIYNSIKEAGAFADDVNTLAKQYNLTTKEIQSFVRASDLVDVELETITKSMAKLTKNMTSTSSSVVSAFQELGIVVTDAEGNLRSSNDVFYETIEALSKVKNETEQDSLAMEIFGKSAADLGTLINGGAEQLDELNKYLEENNLILTQEELDTLNDLNDSFDTLNMTWDAMTDKLAVSLAPALQPVVEMLGEIALEIAPYIEELAQDIAEFLIAHKDNLVQMVKNIVDWLTSDDAKEFYLNCKDLITDKIPRAIENLSIIGDLLSQIGGFLSVALTTAIELFDTLGKILSLDYKGLFTENDAWNNFIDLGGGSVSSGGFGAALKNLSSGGYSSGGITLNNTINVNNNGSNIGTATINSWADQITNRINENLGRML